MSDSKITNSEVRVTAKLPFYNQEFSLPVEMTLYDHQFDVVASGYGSIHANLPPGVYKLEVSTGTEQQSKFYSLTPDKNIVDEIQIEQFPAAAPVEGTSTTHEYHGYTVEKLSLQPQDVVGAGGRLLLFFRQIGNDRTAPLIDGFSLLDKNQQPVFDLNNKAQRNNGEGWTALSVDVEPGAYILRHSQYQPSTWSNFELTSTNMVIDQSLWVSENWTTIVFIPKFASATYPSLQKSSIHMTRIGTGFQYNYDDERIALNLELILNNLRIGKSLIHRDLDKLLRAKFENPILGIIGLHAMFLEQEMRQDLFDKVMFNLRQLVPDHPDVHALDVRRKIRLDDPENTDFSCEFPPMLIAGYKALIRRDATEPSLITDGSIADRVAASIYHEGPWTIWQALDSTLGKELNENLKRKINNIRTKIKSPINIADQSLALLWNSIEQPEAMATEIQPNEVLNVTQYLSDFTEFAAENPTYLEAQQPLTLQTLSHNVGLPVSSVRRSIQQIVTYDIENS